VPPLCAVFCLRWRNLDVRAGLLAAEAGPPANAAPSQGNSRAGRGGARERGRYAVDGRGTAGGGRKGRTRHGRTVPPWQRRSAFPTHTNTPLKAQQGGRVGTSKAQKEGQTALFNASAMQWHVGARSTEGEMRRSARYSLSHRFLLFCFDWPAVPFFCLA